MTRPVEDLTAGARAMYEKLPTTCIAWDRLSQNSQQRYISAFSAGLAAMPDHSAELLEALEVAATQFRFYAEQHLAKVPADTKKAATNAAMALRMEEAIDKARARKGGEND